MLRKQLTKKNNQQIVNTASTKTAKQSQTKSSSIFHQFFGKSNNIDDEKEKQAASRQPREKLMHSWASHLKIVLMSQDVVKFIVQIIQQNKLNFQGCIIHIDSKRVQLLYKSISSKYKPIIVQKQAQLAQSLNKLSRLQCRIIIIPNSVANVLIKKYVIPHRVNIVINCTVPSSQQYYYRMAKIEQDQCYNGVVITILNKSNEADALYKQLRVQSKSITSWTGYDFSSYFKNYSNKRNTDLRLKKFLSESDANFLGINQTDSQSFYSNQVSNPRESMDLQSKSLILVGQQDDLNSGTGLNIAQGQNKKGSFSRKQPYFTKSQQTIKQKQEQISNIINSMNEQIKKQIKTQEGQNRQKNANNRQSIQQQITRNNELNRKIISKFSQKQKINQQNQEKLLAELRARVEKLQESKRQPKGELKLNQKIGKLISQLETVRKQNQKLLQFKQRYEKNQDLILNQINAKNKELQIFKTNQLLNQNEIKQFVNVKKQISEGKNYLIELIILRKQSQCKNEAKRKITSLTLGQTPRKNQQPSIQQLMDKNSKLSSQLLQKPLVEIIKSYTDNQGLRKQQAFSNHYKQLDLFVNNPQKQLKNIMLEECYHSMIRQNESAKFKNTIFYANQLIIGLVNLMMKKIQQHKTEMRQNQRQRKQSYQVRQVDFKSQIKNLNEQVYQLKERIKKFQLSLTQKQGQIKTLNKRLTIKHEISKAVKLKIKTIQSTILEFKQIHEQQLKKIKHFNEQLKQTLKDTIQNTLHLQRKHENQLSQMERIRELLDSQNKQHLQDQKSKYEINISQLTFKFQSELKQNKDEYKSSLEKEKLERNNQINALMSKVQQLQRGVNSSIKKSLKVEPNITLDNFGQSLPNLESSIALKLSKMSFLVESELYNGYNDSEKEFVFNAVAKVVSTRVVATKTLFEGYQGGSWDQWLFKVRKRPNILMLMTLQNGHKVCCFSENPFSNEESKTGSGFMSSITNRKVYPLKSSHQGKAATYDQYMFCFGRNELLVKASCTFSIILSRVFCHFQTNDVPNSEFIGQEDDEGSYKRVEFHQIVFK